MVIYPQIDGVYSDSPGSAVVQVARLRSTRQLWDTTYVHEGWIGQPVYLIPRMKQWVANDYPGTKLAITEYNWGALGYLNGALAEADLLGIFGREGLDLATLWGPPDDANAPGIFAFRMYRNYDGNHSAFGETSLQAASADQEKLAVYAAQRSRDEALTLMIINKTGQDLTSTLALANFQPQTIAEVYCYSSANLAAIVRQPDQIVNSNGFSATYPANSITLVVIPSATLPLTFAVIGDYGMATTPEADVAAMVRSWKPEIIITTGDDYYNSAGGSDSTKYDESIGAYYCDFLKDIVTSGTRCPTGLAILNKFFPSLGNHDFTDAGAVNNLPATYTNYFTLPGNGYTNTSGNERYYDFVSGPVHFFVLDSNNLEPDGTGSNSAQAQWLQSRLAVSNSAWNVVYFHHPPYSSGSHGSSSWIQWPFAEWGADAVLSGHEHSYERLLLNGIVYMVNGAGGADLYSFGSPVNGSVFRYNSNYGAQKVIATNTSITFEFYSIDDSSTPKDSYTIQKESIPLLSISGNAGVSGVVLSYIDNTLKTVTTYGNGNYSIIVPYGWSGVVTPYKAGYTFTPGTRSYGNITSNQSAQNYAASVCSGCADVDVMVKGGWQGSYTLKVGGEKRLFYDLSGGPVKVESTNGKSIVSAIRLQSMQNGTLLDYNETIGIPEGLLSTKYYFPVYENKWTLLSSQVRFAHLGTGTKTIKVTIGKNVYSYDVEEGKDKRISLDESGGPVIVESLDGVTPIIAAIRLQCMSNGVLNCYSETLGIPAERLSTKYYFPVYENKWAPLNSQIRFAHLGTGTKKIKVTIGGEVVWYDDVDQGKEKRLSFDKSGGPVIVESLDGVTPIIAAIRLQGMNNGVLNCYSETPGIPFAYLAQEYYFPVYENKWAPLNSQIRFGVP